MNAGDEFERQREAKERERRDEELGIPNFDALLKWIDQLRDWCRAQAEDTEKLEKRRDDLSDQVDTLESVAAETRDAEAALRELEERLEDVRQGVRTLDEVLDERRRALL